MLSIFMIKNMIRCDWIVCMYLYDVYVFMYRMTNGRFEVRICFYLRESHHCRLKWYARCSFYSTIVWSTSSVGDILIHFMLAHWRMLMPCRRQRFPQLLTIPYVTLIVIHFEWKNTCAKNWNIYLIFKKMKKMNDFVILLLPTF